MNVNHDTETTDSSLDSPRKAPRPRFTPSALPLVQIFRLAAKLSRRGELNVSEACAIHAAARRLGCMADFVVSGIDRNCQDASLDELYEAHKARCALRGIAPRSQARFEQLLLLDPIRVNPGESQHGSDDKSTPAC